MTEQPSGTPAQNTDTPASTPTQTGAANPGSTEAKFTQADVDRILNEKLEKAPAREARIKADLLKQLGLAEDADFNLLKSTIEDARKRKEADMTESEKAKAELDRERKAKDDALTQLQAERAERRNDRIAATLLSEAAKMKAADAETVLMYARDKHRAALDAIMGEDGTLDEKKVKTLLETIKSEKALYFQAVIAGAGSPSNSGGRVAQGSADAQKRASQNTQKLIRG